MPLELLVSLTMALAEGRQRPYCGHVAEACTLTWGRTTVGWPITGPLA